MIPAAATPEEALRQILRLIAHASTITEQEKQEYFDRIMRKKMDQKFYDDLFELLDREAKAREIEIQKIDERMSMEQHLMKTEQQRVQTQADAFVAKHVRKLDTIRADFMGELHKAERECNNGIEHIIRKSEKDQFDDGKASTRESPKNSLSP